MLEFLLVNILLTTSGAAQTTSQQPSAPEPKSHQQLQVNWLYGAFVPKDAPLEPLTNQQRFRLFVRQSFTTPGVYAKTAFFSLSDQITDSPPEWGDGFGGYAKRTASRYGQFVIQNGFSAAGNAFLGFEPRYDRCKCTTFWSRTSHAVLRNFVTYDRTEKRLWPQFALYGAAFSVGVVAGTWTAGNPNLVAKGYQGVTTQAVFGICANWLGEFAPDIKRILRRNKTHESYKS